MSLLPASYTSSDDEDGALHKERSRLSISNPELRSSQLKEMFPGLSEHWRLPLLFQFFLCIFFLMVSNLWHFKNIFTRIVSFVTTLLWLSLIYNTIRLTSREMVLIS